MPIEILDHIIPISLNQKLNGASEPYLILDKNLEKFVIKFLASRHLTPESCCREIIASCLAQYLDLNIPKPVLIEIDNMFISRLDKNHPNYEVCKKSSGFNFGTKFIQNTSIWSNAFESEVNALEIHKIFFFDIFIFNPDRSVLNPNMFYKDHKIYIFDHEKAFSFLYDIIPNATPWKLTEKDLYWIQNHAFFPLLKNKEIYCDEFINNFTSIDATIWDEIRNFLPETWVKDNKALIEFEKIKNNCSLIISEIKEFKNKINEMLCERYPIKF